MTTEVCPNTTKEPNRVQTNNKESNKYQKKIYIYCPVTEIDKIEVALKDTALRFIFNNYDINCFSGKNVLFLRSDMLSKSEKLFLLHATTHGARVQYLTTYLDKHFGYTEVSLLNEQYLINNDSINALCSKKSQLAKSCIDKLSAIFLLSVTLPIIFLTALAIRIEGKGPIFYRQLRVGLHNKQYYVYKFRSMRTDAEINGPQWAQDNDNRVTRVGRFIRNTRIDELPQLLNVLVGNMSMVGPRPEREVFVKELEQTIPYYRFRHAIKPGITGLAQVKYQYGASVDDAIWKHKYDIHYIKHQSLWIDVKIMFKTLPTIFFGMGK
jgi:exopolysaccharide biosynthesis polyprenyl glycosylphosphotransferase